MKVTDKNWNLGDGLGNVVNSLLRKANYASWQLEEKERTIINVDSYEVTALIFALSEYIEKYKLEGVTDEDAR